MLVTRKFLISSVRRVFSEDECGWKRPLDHRSQSAVALVTGVSCPAPTEHLVCALIMSSACNFAGGDERAHFNKF